MNWNWNISKHRNNLLFYKIQNKNLKFYICKNNLIINFIICAFILWDDQSKLQFIQQNTLVGTKHVYVETDQDDPGDEKHIIPHIFRYSIVRYLNNKRFSAEWIQNFSWYASFKTTMDIYGTLSIDEI